MRDVSADEDPGPPSSLPRLRVAVVGAGPAGIYTAEALTALGRALEGKLTGAPEVQVLTAVPAGDEAKGAL